MSLLPVSNRSRLLLLGALLILFISLACMALQDFAPRPTPPALANAPRPELEAETATPLPTPAATPIHCTDDNCLDSCLERVDNALQDRHFASIENEHYQGQTDMDIVAYTVDGDQLSKRQDLWVPEDYRVYQQDTAAHQRIWDFFVSVIPPALRTPLNQMVIYTDGPSNVLAWVKPSPGKGETWTIGFDILDSGDPLDLTDTLIHEVGHLVTLNVQQVPVVDYLAPQTPSTCDQYLKFEACGTESSYIRRFYDRFWRDVYEEWKQIETARDESEHNIMLSNFYDRHGSEFVSGYAVTNPKEDIAESWAVFVLKPKPTGGDIADEKVLFFYDYPELVAARREIIDGLCSYTR